MERKLKIIFHEWLFLVIAWVLFLNIFTWILVVNLDLYFQICGVKDLVGEHFLFKYLSSGFQYLESTLFGIFFGTMFIIINFYTDKTSLRKKSFGVIILMKSFLYFVAMIVSSILIYNLFTALRIVPTNILISDYMEFVTWESAATMIVFISLFIILSNFMLQINRKFGPGNLLKIFTGKYRTPVNENRIFMFLDMKGSTALAEKLGHKRYSQFLKSCYYDLTDVVIKYKADIYQYVGDEVVLTWNVKKGLSGLNCIKAFFSFERALNKRKEFYERNFGTVPVFKAGMDMGIVTVAEIGEIKRDIAYHGDVVNTASRIQDHCNELNQKLLISEHLEKKLTGLNGFSKNYIGEINLRGKEHIVKVYGIDYSKN